MKTLSEMKAMLFGPRAGPSSCGGAPRSGAQPAAAGSMGLAWEGTAGRDSG
jgi:hypothetical protein